MTARPAAAPEEQLVHELPGRPPLPLVGPAPRRPRQSATAVKPTLPVLEPTAAAVGDRCGWCGRTRFSGSTPTPTARRPTAPRRAAPGGPAGAGPGPL